MAKKVLKARDIDSLENTSVASALLGVQGLHGADTVLFAEDTCNISCINICGVSFCFQTCCGICSVGTCICTGESNICACASMGGQSAGVCKDGCDELALQ